MKKLSIALVFILLLSLCVVTLTACGSEMNAPSGLTLDADTLTLKWNAVKGAKYYTVQIADQNYEITTKLPSFSLENLRAGEYVIKIKANGDETVSGSSDWVTYHFTREQESGLRYQLINNGSAYELVDCGSAEGDVVMEDTYRGKPVVSIAKKALYGNTKITSFTVGKNVTTIGEKAFAKCSKLTAVVIPEGVTEIGNYAFQSCKALTSMTLPNSLTVLPAHAFAWCDALVEVTVGNNLREIGGYAFSNCEMLETITYPGCESSYKICLPASLEYVAQYAFADCYALTDVDLGGNVQVIATYAFANCANITKIDLGDQLLGVGDYAFANCSGLSQVVIPDSTEVLSKGVFQGCTALADMTLGKGLISVGADLLTDTAILAGAGKMLVIDGWLIRYLDESADTLRITDGIYGIANKACADHPNLTQVDAKGVKYVGDRAFYQCPQLFRVTFDNALLQVGGYSFFKCSYLKNVSLGNSLQTIGNCAFASCKALKTMDIPDSVTSIGAEAFHKTAAFNEVTLGVVYMDDWAVDFVYDGQSMGTTSLKEGTRGIANYAFTSIQWLSVVMPDSVEYVGRGAFYSSKIMLISLSKNLKIIDDYAFYACDFTSFGANYVLEIPSTTEYIGRSAFYGCGSILSAIIPGSVKTIGDYAFYGCSGMGDHTEFSVDTGKVDEEGNPIYEMVPYTGFLQLGEGIETIGERAFQGCNYLTKVSIPNSVTSLGSHAFYRMEALESVTLGTGITEIPRYTFYKCPALKTVITLGEITAVGEYAFRGCESLTAFDATNLTTIGRYAFYGCKSLKQLEFTNNLVSIGNYAFRGCSSITSFVLPASVQTIGKHAFYGLNGMTLYCEATSAPDGWSEHFNSSFRPVFWGCQLSEDGSHVVSVFAGKNLENSKATRGISAPVRTGYVFQGWSVEQGDDSAEFDMKSVAESAGQQELYALWLPVDYAD